MQFAVADWVRVDLGPVMRVNNLLPGRKIGCLWFDHTGAGQRSVFAMSLLERVEVTVSPVAACPV